MKTFLCISTYFKGGQFLEALKEDGHKVLFITSERLMDSAWPWHAIDDIYYLPEEKKNVFNIEHLELGVAALMREQKIDRIIALDDFDVEKAASLREQFRVPGMGHTTYRYFRDKLAMRQKAEDEGIPQPRFSSVFNNQTVEEFMAAVPAPWVLKPRSEASASGIKVLKTADQLWETLHALGDERHLFLLEEYVSGDVFHADSLTYNKEILFQSTSKYLVPPLDLVSDGGIFQSITCDYEGDDDLQLRKLNARLLSTFGLVHGASHSEFIKDTDGNFCFLETSARVAGARLSQMIYQATGINLWKEWAHIESALVNNSSYQLPQNTRLHAGILMSAIPEEYADYQIFNDDNIVWTAHNMRHHVGMIIKNESRNEVLSSMDNGKKIIFSTHFNSGYDS